MGKSPPNPKHNFQKRKNHTFKTTAVRTKRSISCGRCCLLLSPHPFTFFLPGVVRDADPRQRRGSDGEVYRQPPARVRQLQLALVAASERRQPVGAQLTPISGGRACVSGGRRRVKKGLRQAGRGHRSCFVQVKREELGPGREREGAGCSSCAEVPMERSFTTLCRPPALLKCVQLTGCARFSP